MSIQARLALSRQSNAKDTMMTMPGAWLKQNCTAGLADSGKRRENHSKCVAARWDPPRRSTDCASRSLQSICKDINFVIRFGRIGCGGGNHGCEGHFGKEVCCAGER